MSIEQDVEITTTIVKVKDRTWRLECFTEYGTDYRLVAHRERVYVTANGEVVKREELPQIVRTVSQVMGEQDAMAMLASIRDKVDIWAGEDAAPAA